MFHRFVGATPFCKTLENCGVICIESVDPVETLAQTIWFSVIAWVSATLNDLIFLLSRYLTLTNTVLPTPPPPALNYWSLCLFFVSLRYLFRLLPTHSPRVVMRYSARLSWSRDSRAKQVLCRTPTSLPNLVLAITFRDVECRYIAMNHFLYASLLPSISESVLTLRYFRYGLHQWSIVLLVSSDLHSAQFRSSAHLIDSMNLIASCSVSNRDMNSKRLTRMRSSFHFPIYSSCQFPHWKVHSKLMVLSN